MDRRIVLDYLSPIMSCLVISLGFVRLFLIGGMDLTIPGDGPGVGEQMYLDGFTHARRAARRRYPLLARMAP